MSVVNSITSCTLKKIKDNISEGILRFVWDLHRPVGASVKQILKNNYGKNGYVEG